MIGYFVLFYKRIGKFIRFIYFLQEKGRFMTAAAI